MNDTPETPRETPAEALKRVLAAKKAGANGSGSAFKPARHPEQSVQAQNAALAKPAFKKASKRG